MRKIDINIFKKVIHSIMEDPKKRKVLEKLILQAILEYTKKTYGV